MLKLLKYEMIQNYRSFALIFAIFLLACVSLPFLPENMSLIAYAVMTFAMIGMLVTVFLTIVRGYHSSMFQKPGYLTLTLPISTQQIVLSKIIAAAIWWLLTGIVILIGVVVIALITTYRYWDELIISQFLFQVRAVLSYLGLYNIETAIKLIVNSFVSVLTSISGIFALVTVVQTKYTRKHKVAIGFVICIVYAILVQTIIVNGLIPSYNTIDPLDLFDQYFYVMLAFNVIQVTIFYLVTVYVVSKKIEIE